MTRTLSGGRPLDTGAAALPDGPAESSRLSLVRRWGPLLLLLAGVASWAASLTQVDTTLRSDYGLLGLVGPLFSIGLGLVCASFVWELADRRRALALTAGIVALALVVNASVPLLYAMPEYAWTYKHIGVVEFFSQGPGVTDPRDIYHQWPALFTGVAALADLTGVSVLALAAWAPLFFSLLASLPLYAIARQLSPDRRVAFLTVFLFHATLWVGTSYLSPQALAFQLGLGFLLVVVTWLRRTPTEWRRGPRALRRLKAWSVRGADPVPEVSRRARGVALAGLYLITFAITISHQLSPYILIAGLVLVTMLGAVRPRWAVVGCIVIALGYLAPRLALINSAYGLLDSLRFWENAGGVVTTTTGTAGQVFTSRVSSLLALSVWLLGAAAVVASWRRPGRVLLPAAFAFAPFLVLAGQSYGGEAIYRVYLFSLPFTAFLIAQAALRLRWRRLVMPVLAVLLFGAALASIQGLHGTLAWSTFPRNEVQASQWLYENGEEGRMIVVGAQNAPGRLSGNYNDFGVPSSGGDPDLIAFAGLGGRMLDEANLAVVEEFMATQGDRPYLVLSTSMMEYAQYYGLLPDGSLQALEQELATAPGWTTVHETADAVIFQYTGTPQ
ncbi:hypothetical protein O2W18_01195 [Modestobacter sp. VKM Ac-2983]|uniref:hypothetical protein n=1 Tax=Modestobacter sp. VKM Ac-2983 TaxID=3004137 RepID=UPI0022AB5E4D|nr:hypothetical protein [Modestobacter sp. VKM Ac-2983]MCZ2803716.1 hypothetical protein [Modestobacter sp. VKM Ac-2983]